jgi:2,3-bisphosphoglycerate-independent phosphoglycerate mutase
MPESEIPKTVPKPIVLCILDGWGARDEDDHNAIALARTPHWDRLVASSPSARLDASEQEVGLPAGQMGNSEVGHMNLGAGRIVMQNLPRIDAAIAAGALDQIPTLRD